MEQSGKIIVITGASDGLGKELSLWAASKQLKVVLISKSSDKLQEVKEQILEQNGIAESFVCDISDSIQVQKCIEQVIEKFGRIDILINNAGVWIEGELTENKYESIKKVIEVNTLGTIYVTKSVLELMKKQKSGLIINVISQAGLYAKPLRSVYNASKWAVTGFTKCLQAEVPKYGVRITGFYPGLMDTGLFEKVGVNKDKTNALKLQQVISSFDFLLSLNEEVMVPELGLKNIDN